MIEVHFIIIYCLLSVSFIIYIILFTIRRCKFRNNIVDIDTGTEICTEVNDIEYKQNIGDNIIFTNIMDIESTPEICIEYDNYEFKDFNNNIEIREPISI
jgi:hypothetical protein